MEYPIRYKKITTTKATPNSVQVRDLFETPNYATELLVPFIPKSITHIWEPAAGHLKITNILKSHGYNVFSSDIREDLESVTPSNFLTDIDRTDIYRHPTAIVTNPPYSVKSEFIEKAFHYDLPFAFLISAEYSGRMIKWIEQGCEKIIPTRRINYITPSGRQGETSSSQFHTMWLTYKFGLGRTETFVELTNKDKENI